MGPWLGALHGYPRCREVLWTVCIIVVGIHFDVLRKGQFPLEKLEVLEHCASVGVLRSLGYGGVAAVSVGAEQDAFAAGELDAHFPVLKFGMGDVACHGIVKQGFRIVHSKGDEGVNIVGGEIADEVVMSIGVAAADAGKVVLCAHGLGASPC